MKIPKIDTIKEFLEMAGVDITKGKAKELCEGDVIPFPGNKIRNTPQQVVSQPQYPDNYVRRPLHTVSEPNKEDTPTWEFFNRLLYKWLRSKPSDEREQIIEEFTKNKSLWAEDALCAYAYAVKITKQRFPEGEKAIANFVDSFGKHYLKNQYDKHFNCNI